MVHNPTIAVSNVENFRSDSKTDFGNNNLFQPFYSTSRSHHSEERFRNQKSQ